MYVHPPANQVERQLRALGGVAAIKARRKPSSQRLDIVAIADITIIVSHVVFRAGMNSELRALCLDSRLEILKIRRV